MSASNCPETPRQKMIQMLYLVYTAMLALNVSAEVLNGFVTVGDAMNKSNVSLQSKLSDSYAVFEKAYNNNPEKTTEGWKKAQQVKQLSEELENYIDSLECGFLCMLQESANLVTFNKNEDGSAEKVARTITLRNGEAEDPSAWLIDSAQYALSNYGLGVLNKPDDNNNGTRYFLNSSNNDHDNPADDARALVLKKRIIDYKKAIRNILGDDSTKVPMALNIEGETYSEHAKRMVTWEQQNFNNTISIAAMVVLSRMKAEVMTAEYDAVKLLYNSIGADDFKFDKITYVTKPVGGSGYVMQGGKYETEVRIAAYDSKTPFRVVAGGGSKQSDADGTVVISGNTSSVGEHKITGSIYVKGHGDQEEKYDFEERYYVAAPAAVVELTNMNVVYTGIENPVKISAPGVDSRNLRVEITEGSGTFTHKGGEEYVFTTKQIGKSIAYRVNAIDGKTVRTMGSGKFRVRSVPEPGIMVGSKKNNEAVTVTELTNYGFKCSYGADFTFQLRPPVISSFNLDFSKGGEFSSSTPGGKLTPDMVDRLKKARNGERVYVSAITKTPDGRTIPISAAFKIKK